MITIPYRNYGQQDNKEMVSLIDPDGRGPWALRYLWIQHTTDNDLFFNNYFNSGNQTGLNVRKQTQHLNNDWTKHNQIFEDSTANGNLVWRVKIGNYQCRSIDYIEIWRNSEILENYFGDGDSKINKTTAWLNDERNSFAKNLYETGFDLRVWLPYQSISKELAAKYWNEFLEKYKNKDSCIINTPWNQDLNPL